MNAMPREIVVGNGCLSVALDKRMMVRDFTFPLVGWRTTLLGLHAGTSKLPCHWKT